LEYSDFECPSCRTAQGVLREILQEYPGKIQLQFKHFPLTAHKWSSYAHQAAECMNAQEKFWPYHDLLYGKQLEWAASKTPPLEILKRYAVEVGANTDRFDKCMLDVEVKRKIYAEKEEGTKQQVNATPTFIIGEERFVGAREMQTRGVNAIRKILGLPPKPIPEEKPSTPVFPTGIPKQKVD
jgi:protein-disulfide isomerase